MGQLAPLVLPQRLARSDDSRHQRTVGAVAALDAHLEFVDKRLELPAPDTGIAVAWAEERLEPEAGTYAPPAPSAEMGEGGSLAP